MVVPRGWKKVHQSGSLIRWVSTVDSVRSVEVHKERIGGQDIWFVTKITSHIIDDKELGSRAEAIKYALDYMGKG